MRAERRALTGSRLTYLTTSQSTTADQTALTGSKHIIQLGTISEIFGCIHHLLHNRT
jgi:hypothetical protein